MARTARAAGGRQLSTWEPGPAGGDSEAVPRLAVRVAEHENLVGPDLVHQRAAPATTTGVAELDELLAADLELPVLAVLGEPRRRQVLQRRRIRHADRRALDHHVLAAVPAVRAGAPRRHSHVRVDVEVALLLLLGARAEREGTVLPDAHERHRMRTPVRADGDDPVQLRVYQQALDGSPRRCDSRRVAVPRVDLSGRHAPSDSPSDRNSSAWNRQSSRCRRCRTWPLPGPAGPVRGWVRAGRGC